MLVRSANMRWKSITCSCAPPACAGINNCFSISAEIRNTLPLISTLWYYYIDVI